jgi:hypothetical protein
MIYGVPNQQSRPYNYYNLFMERKKAGLTNARTDNFYQATAIQLAGERSTFLSVINPGLFLDNSVT